MNTIQSVCVYSASSTKIADYYFRAARELCELLAHHGIRLVNGAGNLGLMRACADACLKQQPLPDSILGENMRSEDFCDHHDHFENTTVDSEYKTCLEHGEKIGLGSRAYELIVIK